MYFNIIIIIIIIFFTLSYPQQLINTINFPRVKAKVNTLHSTKYNNELIN
jgi:hypothetical protein